MKIMSASLVKAHFSVILKRTEGGEQIIITKYGRPVAKLTPVFESTRTNLSDTIRKLKEFNKPNKLNAP